MLVPKIRAILGSLNLDEQASFRLFLQSPFFVPAGADTMLTLLDYLNASEGGALDEALLFTLLFPEKAFSKSRLWRALARFAELLDLFLVHVQCRSDEEKNKRALDLAAAYRKRKLSGLYRKNMESIHDAMESDAFHSEEKYWWRYEVLREEQRWVSTTTPTGTGKSIIQVMEQLNIAYFTEKYRQIGSLMQQQNLGFPGAAGFIAHAIEAPDQSAEYTADSPLLLLRKKVAELYYNRTFNMQQFEELMQLFEEKSHCIAPDVLVFLRVHLRSFCTNMYNHGHDEAVVILRKLHLHDLKQGYFYFEGKLSPYTLNSIVKVALMNKEIEWAKQFLEENRDKMLTDLSTQEAFYYLSRSWCLFVEKQYDAALEAANLVVHDDYCTLVARRIELMVYYELDSDLVFYKAEAYKKYLQRSANRKLDHHNWKMANNFINILLQIIHSPPTDRHRSERILSRIQQLKSVAEHAWLIEKTKALGRVK